MAKVLIATEKPFAQKARDMMVNLIKESQLEPVVLEKYADKKELLAAVSDVEALIVRSDKIDKEVFEAAKNLKVVVRAGAGYDSIDCQEATNHGVCVMNTPGQNSNAVAELVFGLLIYMVRNQYNGKSGTELKGRKIGIHAFGNVGANVARLAKGFEMEVYAYDAFCRPERMEAMGVKPVATAEELYQICDVISLHLPATAETIGSINKSLVSKMPEGAILVNTARKEVINDVEIYQLMKEREDFRYVTDIKPSNDLEFATDFPDRYFSTPKKMGAQTAEANENAGLAAVRQIADFLKTGNAPYKVNK